MQLKGDIGILRRVAGGLCQGHLMEADLLGSLAGDVFVLDGVATKIFPCQRVQIVPRGCAVEHIGFQHGIEGDALQGDTVAR